MAKRRPRRELNKGSTYEKTYKETKQLFTRLYNYKTYNRLLKRYKQVAKQADQRLVRLEKAAKEPGYENITAYAYKRAAQDVKAWDIASAKQKGRKPKEYALPRFNRNIPTTLEGLKSKLTDIERFLLSATSTKAGTEEVYKKRAEAINKKVGFRRNDKGRLTWQDIKAFYDSELASVLTEKGYYSTMRAIGEIKRKTVGKNPAEIKNIAARNIRISNDKNIDAVAKELLNLGYDPNIVLSKFKE